MWLSEKFPDRSGVVGTADADGFVPPTSWYPLYVAPPTWMDLLTWRHIGCMRRKKQNKWNLIPRDTQPGGNGNLRGFWEAVARNIDRDRHRWQHAEVSPIPEGVGPLTLADGPALQIPPGDEMAPDPPQGTLPFSLHLVRSSYRLKCIPPVCVLGRRHAYRQCPDYKAPGRRSGCAPYATSASGSARGSECRR